MTKGLIAAVLVILPIVANAAIIDFTNKGTFTAPSYSEQGLTVSASTGVGLLNLNGIGVVGGTSDSLVDPGESLLFDFDFGVSNVLLNFGPSISSTFMLYVAFDGLTNLGSLVVNASTTATPLALSALYENASMTSFSMMSLGGAPPGGDDVGRISFDATASVPEPPSLALLAAALAVAFGVAGTRSGKRQPSLV